MTPSELLDEAKSRFIVLYHNDSTKLNGLLRQALGKFSDKAGVTVTATIPFTSPDNSGLSPTEYIADTPMYYAPLPSYFKDIAVAKDAKGKWHEVVVGTDPETNEPCLIFSLDDTSVSPMIVEYFVDMREWDEDTNLPNGVVSSVLDYLVALIDVPNTERERAVSQQSGQTPELPSKSELMQRIDQIEQGWEENAAFIGSSVLW